MSDELVPAAPEPSGDSPVQAPAPVDPGAASLSRALGLSFLLLKALMLVVLALFLLSCLRSIEETEVGIVRRFGRILTNDDGSIKLFRSGRPYFIWPEPLEQLEVVRTGTDHLLLTEEFWPQARVGADSTNPNQPVAKGELLPAVDGYCLTGDFHFVHTRWRIDYGIDADHPQDYFLGTATNRPGLTPEERHQARLEILRLAARAAVVKVLAGLPIDDILGGTLEGDPTRVTALVLKELQAAMRDPKSPDRYRGGISVGNVSLLANEPPGRVKPDFDQGLNAAIEAQNRKTRAHAEAVGVLTRAQTEANKIVEDARVYEKTVVANAAADAERITAFLERFPNDRKGLMVAAEQYKYDRLKEILLVPRVMKIPPSHGGSPNVLTIAPPADAPPATPKR